MVLCSLYLNNPLCGLALFQGWHQLEWWFLQLVVEPWVVKKQQEESFKDNLENPDGQKELYTVVHLPISFK